MHLSDRGIDELSPDDPDAFLIPDLSEAVGEIQEDEGISEDEKKEEVEWIGVSNALLVAEAR